jgi:hypothetical protein
MMSAKRKKSQSERMKEYWAKHRDEMKKKMKLRWNIKKNADKATGVEVSEASLPGSSDMLECAKNEKVVHCPYCAGMFGLYSK